MRSDVVRYTVFTGETSGCKGKGQQTAAFVHLHQSGGISQNLNTKSILSNKHDIT